MVNVAMNGESALRTLVNSHLRELRTCGTQLLPARHFYFVFLPTNRLSTASFCYCIVVGGLELGAKMDKIHIFHPYIAK